MSTAKDCRDHADECEALAKRSDDPATIKSYTDLARVWRELADKMDEMIETDGTAAKKELPA